MTRYDHHRGRGSDGVLRAGMGVYPLKNSPQIEYMSFKPGNVIIKRGKKFIEVPYSIYLRNKRRKNSVKEEKLVGKESVDKPVARGSNGQS